MSEYLGFVLMSGMVGLIAEAVAYKLRLWVYQKRFWLFINICVVFGWTFGTISYCLRSENIPLQYAAGTSFGICYELINFAKLDWWRFPENKLYFLRGKFALAFGVGMLWGCVVPIVVAALKIIS